MNSTLKKVSLFGFLFAGSLGIPSLFNSAYAVQTITINPATSQFEHVARLHSIYFDHTDTKVWIKAGQGKLNVLNGLAVSKDGNASVNTTSKGVIIGGGESNVIDGSNSGIGGGKSNRTWGESNVAAIGGGISNNTHGNYSVIAGGYGNNAENGGTVIGGSNATSKANGIALGGSTNTANDNSLIMGKNLVGNDGSFGWNDSNSTYTVQANQARINATKGVLIGTYSPINGTKLVVAGPIKLNAVDSSTSGIKGEIKVDSNGCIYAYYNGGNTRHVLGRASGTSCGERNTCKFGRTVLQDGEKAKAYNTSFAANCGGGVEVTCNNGTLSPAGYVYPYCYSLGNSML